MYKIANQEPPDLREMRKELPEALALIVARALTKKPELRYQDGEEFARDLRAVAATMADAPAAATPSAPDERTLAFQAAPAAAEGTPVMAAGNAFVSGAATPGYDAGQKDELARAPANNTIVMNKSGAPERPRDGTDPAGQEP
jgi:serine/threonine-protein kinase